MTPTEVRAVLGTPTRTIREGGEVRWMVYESGPNQFRVYFREGTVAAVPGRRKETADREVP